MFSLKSLQKLCQLIRYDILNSTTTAGSGHPTSCLSAVELMTTLFFGGFFHYDLKNPHNIFNDRVVFSKGHAAPLFYSLYHAAGVLLFDELLTLRTFNSRLEGHPTPRFPYVDVATGSLGQGLSIGAGMALGIKLRIEGRSSKLDIEDRSLKLEKNQTSNFQPQNPASSFQPLSSIPKVFVLLGDGEMTEGSVWEALELASCYHLNNLIGILDLNRFELAGPTIHQWDISTFEKRIQSFGWNTVVVEDGHDLKQVNKAFEKIAFDLKPTMIIAKTVKGKGVSFLENKDGWHGKPVPKDMLQSALKGLGKVDLTVRGKILPSKFQISNFKFQIKSKIQNSNNKNMFHVSCYKLQDLVATREAYGEALVELAKQNDNILVLDADVRPSTYADKFYKQFPDRFFEMHIAEQNMIGMALGLSKMGYTVFSSTFASFLTRAFDQIRMGQYSNPNIKICGSHAGVSIGEDGPSQMGLEDLAMMRSILNSVVFYPSDGTSTQKLVEIMTNNDGLFYLRTSRGKTPVIYDEKEKFEIGGSKVHKVNKVFKVHKVKALIIAAGITLHEALKAQKELAKDNIETVVMDCYSVKPIDVQSIKRLTQLTKNVVVVEDHYPYGGLGEAVKSSLSNVTMKQCNNFIHLCVHKIPRSGKPAELLHYEEIDTKAIVKNVRTLLP